MTHKDDTAELQRKAVALDAKLAAHLSLPPKQRDHNGELDLRQAAVRVQAEITRLQGPLRPLR